MWPTFYQVPDFDHMGASDIEVKYRSWLQIPNLDQTGHKQSSHHYTHAQFVKGSGVLLKKSKEKNSYTKINKLAS